MRCDSGEPIQAALDTVLSQVSLPAQDRALVAELAYGVLRMRIAIDARCATVLQKPHKLPHGLTHVLAIGVYSLFYADRIPAHASIDTAVSLAHKRFGRRFANLVNACLRTLQRDVQSRQWKPQAGDVWRNLSLLHSLPAEIIKLWRMSYGSGATLQLVRRSSARPWTGIRINASSRDAAELRNAIEALPQVEKIGTWGFAFPPGAVPQLVCGKPLASWYDCGALSFQAAGSQLVMEKLGLFSLKGSFWDCCSGVGGKSLPLLERGCAVTLSSDVSVERLAQLGRDCKRLGLVEPMVREADASAFVPQDFKGHILVDAPCSSLGVLARRPDVRKRKFDSVSRATFVSIQRAILDHASGICQPGCCIAYMTCTLNPEENEGQISAFLSRHKNFVQLSQWQTPHNHPWLEGMFGALLQKVAD